MPVVDVSGAKVEVDSLGSGRDLVLLHSLLAERSASDVLGSGFGGFIAVALAARVEKEGMAGALDIAIRRMFPESFIAAHPDIVQERKRALEKADPACFRSACLALARVDS